MNNEPSTQVGYQDPEADMIRLLKPWLKSYTSESSIDWSGRYPLTHTGAIDEQKARDIGLPLHSGIRPIPLVARGSEKYRELLEALHHARKLATPASSAEAGFELKRLSVWCPMQNRDVRDFKMMLHDALNDLSEYPADLIRQACTRYRNDPDPRNDFFPRPGRLKASIEHKLRERKILLYRLERLLSIANEPPKLPPVVTLNELKEQAKTQIEVSQMLAAFSNKKPKELTPEEERERFAKIIEDKIRQALSGRHITRPEAETMFKELHSEYQDIFLTAEKEQNHDTEY